MLVAKTCCFLPEYHVNKYDDAKALEAQLAKILRTTTRSRDLFVVREQDRTIVPEI